MDNIDPEIKAKNKELQKKKRFSANRKRWIINNYSNWDNVITVENYTRALNVTYSTYFNWQNRKEDDRLKDKSFRPDNSPKATKKEQLIKALEVY